MHVSKFNCIIFMNIMFWIDLDAPDVDVLTEDLQNANKTKIDDSWSPYESKMGSKLFDPQLMIKHTFLFTTDVPPQYP